MARRQRRQDAGPEVGNLEHDNSTNEEAVNVSGKQLLDFIKRIERLEEEKKAVADDVKELYALVKGNGFNTKIVRQIVKRRKQDHAERLEQEALLDTYEHAIGMAPDESDAADEE